MPEETQMRDLDSLIWNLICEYSQMIPGGGAWTPTLSLRKDLAIDSLSLVSLTLRLGDELSVDVVDLGLDLGGLDTIGDLIALGHSLLRHSQSPFERRP
jgi:acyl carrier protein